MIKYVKCPVCKANLVKFENKSSKYLSFSCDKNYDYLINFFNKKLHNYTIYFNIVNQKYCLEYHADYTNFYIETTPSEIAFTKKYKPLVKIKSILCFDYNNPLNSSLQIANKLLKSKLLF